MTDEERRRTMEFIVERQIQIAARLDQLEKERIHVEPQQKELEKSLQLLEQLIEKSRKKLRR